MDGEHWPELKTQRKQKSEWARTWECPRPFIFRGYCPHPSNHLRRRIHQPSLLPRNIHRKPCAVQENFLRFTRCLFSPDFFRTAIAKTPWMRFCSDVFSVKILEW